MGEAARGLYADATRMLATLIAEKWLKARAVIGFFPANSVGDDDIEVYRDEGARRASSCGCTICASRRPSRRIRRSCA